MTRQTNQSAVTESSGKGKKYSYCSLPKTPVRVLGPNVNPERASLINLLSNKWANGTVLHYYFFDRDSDGAYVYFSDGTREWRAWKGDDDQQAVVRKGFEVWEKVGIGIQFKDVSSREEAEIRIGFMQGDGAWSYIGRYVLNIGSGKRTMNFGWDLTRHAQEIDTAVHEVGHTLGFPHEHQNPNAGIVWDEEAVYATLAEPPNSWPRDKTYYNIIRKIDPDTVQGSNWDPNSIMHYPFGPGLIERPERYATGLTPDPGLSDRDRAWVRAFYSGLDPQRYPELEPFQLERLTILEGQQENFIIRPRSTRYFNIRTVGVSDTVMVLFEDVNGDLQYRTADDDSGEDYNARLRVKLVKDHKYVLRIRLYYSERSGETAVMMW